MQQYRIVCLLYMSNATLRFWCGLLYYLWNPLIRMMVLEHQTSNFNLVNPFNKLPPLSATITFMGSSLPGNTWKWMVNASNQDDYFHLEIVQKANRRMSWAEEGHRPLHSGDLRGCAPSFLLCLELQLHHALGLDSLVGRMKALG